MGSSSSVMGPLILRVCKDGAWSLFKLLLRVRKDVNDAIELDDLWESQFMAAAAESEGRLPGLVRDGGGGVAGGGVGGKK